MSLFIKYKTMQKLIKYSGESKLSNTVKIVSSIKDIVLYNA